MNSSDPPSPTTSRSSSRKRANKPKVRTGCLTCKQRRVKCDETKPHCTNCTKSRRNCGGYEFDSQESVDMLLEKRKEETALPKHRGLLPASELSLIPTQAYDEDFITSQMGFLETSRETPSIFGMSARNQIIAEAGKKHSYVKHAVAAIDSLNKRVRESLMKSERSMESGSTLPFLSAESEFALQAYDEFLKGSREAATEGTQSTRMALIGCFLIIGIETLLCNHSQATSQIWSCIKLLEAWLSSKTDDAFSGLESPDPAAIENNLFREIRLLDVEGNWLNDPRSKDHHEKLRLEGRNTILYMPETFESIYDSRSYLELIIRRTHHFIRAVRSGKDSRLEKGHELKNVCFYTEFDHMEAFDGLYNSSAELLAEEQERYAQEIARWSSAFSLFFITQPRVFNPRDMLTSQLLKIRAAAIKILLYGELSTTELVYDAFLVEFREIVLLAKEFFQNPEIIKTAPEGGFTANSGLLYPLRLVAEKCRDKRTRCDAISLMKSTPWREGPWWSSSVAQIGEWLMSVEEEDLGYRDGEDTVLVPEWARARLISVDFRQDKSSRMANYICVRGSGENTRIRHAQFMV